MRPSHENRGITIMTLEKVVGITVGEEGYWKAFVTGKKAFTGSERREERSQK